MYTNKIIRKLLIEVKQMRLAKRLSCELNAFSVLHSSIALWRRSPWPNGLRRRSAVDRSQGLRGKSRPIMVAEGSQARVCGRLFAGIAGSNPAGDMDVCVLCCK